MLDIKIIIDDISLDKELITEHGFSSYITNGDKKILFDTGEYGNVVKNARKMNINLLDLDYIVLSHGHHDHTNGLESIIKIYTDNNVTIEQRPVVIAHASAFDNRSQEGQCIGSSLSLTEIKKAFKVKLLNKLENITDNIIYLGEIPRNNDFENKIPVGEVINNGNSVPDFLIDDTALACKTDSGLVIITGCSHSGICNIVEYATTVINEKRIVNIIGGLHLKDSSELYISKVIEELNKYNINKISACHCTGNKALNLFAENGRLSINRIGCGYSVNYL